MKASLSCFLVLVLATIAHGATHPTPSPARFTAKEVAQGYREHVILARPRASDRGTVDSDEAREHIHVRETFSRFGDLRVIDLDATDNADAAIARLRATGRYDFVEPDYLRYVQATPNDPKMLDGSLWAFQNTGQFGNVQGVPGADIEALSAWDIIHDAPNVIVAVVDTGINLSHQDIAANLWVNPNPTNSDLHGANFVGGSGRLVSGNPGDDEGHGTHVAGIIGAVGNNGIAVSGVAWKVQLMAVKVLGSDGSGTSSDIVGGINYAISHGANIINASFGADNATGYSSSELSAMASARSSGVIVVAAAGNSTANLDVSRSYPASYALDNIVTVGSSNRRDEVSTFSNYGAAIDLFAPGEEIVSLDYSTTAGTISYSGTSMAAPEVSGALALLRAQFPNDSYRQLINRLLRGAKPGPNFAGRAQTGGRLDLLRSLQTTTNTPFNDNFADRPRFNTDNLTIRANNDGATAEPGEPAIAGSPATSTLWWEWTAPASGTVSVDTNGSAYDTVLAVYTGNAVSALTLVTANDNAGANITSRVTFTAQVGTTYEIAVDGKNNATGLTLVNLGTTPANDAFASPSVLSGQSTHVTATNLHCSREPGEPTILGFSGGNSLWYQWTAPRTGRFQVAVTSNDFDPILAVYTGTSLGSLNAVSASDNTGADNSNTAALCTIDATAGTTYMITVDSKTASSVGQFTLTLVDSQWQATTGNGITGAPAVAPDGTVYVGSTDKSLYAFAADGSQKWTYATGGLIDTCSPAIADDGTVYVGSADGYLYAINANGTLKWRHNFNGTTAVGAGCSPAIAADGTVYIRVTDGYLHALNPSDGSEKWKANINSRAGGFYGNPVVGADGTIYQGSDETDHKLYAFNPDGSSKWTFPLAANEGVYGAPAIDAAGNLYVATLIGTVYSITPSGTQRWTISAGGDISSSVALSADGGTMYFGGYDAKLYALDTATGAQRWTPYVLGDQVRASSPAVDSNGVIYIGAYDGKLYAINADGSLNRVYDTANWVRSAPAIAGNRLYVGSNDQKLYAFNLAGSAAAGAWPQYRANARRLGRRVTDAAPTFTVQPQSLTVIAGTTVYLTATAAGSPTPTYQWNKNGTAIPGATSATLTLPAVSTSDAATYTVTAANSTGTVTSTGATLALGSAASRGRIINMSVLTSIDPGEQFTFGYYTGGSGTTGTKPILMRAMGPTLAAAPFNIGGTLSDPTMKFFNDQTLAAQDDDWGADPAIRAAVTAVQAFPFISDTSKDAAIYAPAVDASTGHSIQVSGVGGSSGTVIAELYDATPSSAYTASTPRLVNVSLIKNVGAITTVGFYIDGGTSANVLIRAVGPSIAAAPYNIAGAMADPKLALYAQRDTSTPLATNDDWQGTADLKAAFQATKAFSLISDTSKDAALVLTLPPGGYSVQVSAATGSTGVALVEVYEVP